VQFANPSGSWSLHRDFRSPHGLYDIIYDITHQKKLAKLREQLATLRQRGGINSRELENLAKAMGRRQHQRGKKPTSISDLLPNRPPPSISRQSRDLNKFTAGSILGQREEDLDMLKEMHSKG
jgi:hypothetical protein